jgi:hypothetical protein
MEAPERSLQMNRGLFQRIARAVRMETGFYDRLKRDTALNGEALHLMALVSVATAIGRMLAVDEKCGWGVRLLVGGIGALLTFGAWLLLAGAVLLVGDKRERPRASARWRVLLPAPFSPARWISCQSGRNRTDSASLNSCRRRIPHPQEHTDCRYYYGQSYPLFEDRPAGESRPPSPPSGNRPRRLLMPAPAAGRQAAQHRANRLRARRRPKRRRSSVEGGLHRRPCHYDSILTTTTI